VKHGFAVTEQGFDLHFADRLILSHSADRPVVRLARGNPTVEMVRGNFRIEDAPEGEIAPQLWSLDGDVVELADGDGPAVRLSFDGTGVLGVELLRPGYDRIHVFFAAEPDETVWGGGEQMSYLALNGRAYPIWTSEPGVGRDKSTELTRLMDEQGMAGGDYWNTNYPQPTFLTSRWLAVHCTSAAYSVLDFTDPARHRVEVWAPTATFELFAASGPLDLVEQLSERFGRQPPLPDWAIGGAIVGLKDGVCEMLNPP